MIVASNERATGETAISQSANKRCRSVALFRAQAATCAAKRSLLRWSKLIEMPSQGILGSMKLNSARCASTVPSRTERLDPLVHHVLQTVGLAGKLQQQLRGGVRTTVAERVDQIPELVGPVLKRREYFLDAGDAFARIGGKRKQAEAVRQKKQILIIVKALLKQIFNDGIEGRRDLFGRHRGASGEQGLDAPHPKSSRPIGLAGTRHQ